MFTVYAKTNREPMPLKHSDLFGKFGKMNCPPVKIKLKSDAQPYQVHAPRRVSEPLLQPVKEELQRMVKKWSLSHLQQLN